MSRSTSSLNTGTDREPSDDRPAIELFQFEDHGTLFEPSTNAWIAASVDVFEEVRR